MANLNEEALAFYKELNSQLASGGAVGVKISDVGTVVGRNAYLTGIGYAAGTEGVVADLAGNGLTAYRVRCSAACRFTEDAANLLQAQAWLQTGAAKTAGQVEFRRADANEWSEWQTFPSDQELSNVYISLDAAGTGATADVEFE